MAKRTFIEWETSGTLYTEVARGKVTLIFSYYSDHPYTITMDIHHETPEGSKVTCWPLDRDMLRTGLRKPVGEGDIEIVPNMHNELDIHLTNGYGAATVALDLSAVGNFIQNTDRLVAPGRESLQVNWDHEMQFLGI